MATPIEQLEAMRSLPENWDGYGAAVPLAAVIELAQEFASLVEAMLKRVTSHLCIVHVGPTRTRGVLIEWEDQTRQHEVEINPDRSIGFLHLDKATGQIETRQFSAGPLHPGNTLSSRT